MNLGILYILLTISSQPGDSVVFSRNFEHLECYQNALYLGPLIGRSILRLHDHDSLTTISITDEVNYRMSNFRLTPFAIYINRGGILEKYYLTSGKRETVFTSRDISSFDLSPPEEIILADRQKHELLFLDFTYTIRFKIENILIEDLRWYEDQVYVLTKNSVHIYDEHGNLVEKKLTPEFCNRIKVVNHKILIFTEKSNYLYIADKPWMKKEFPFTILDVCEKEQSVIILDGLGTTLRVFDRNDF